jgi:Cytochrome c556
MLIRTMLAGLAVSLCVTAVIAQTDPVKTRRGLMKQNNDHAKVLVEMMRGQRSFDRKAVEVAFAQWADTAQKLPGLFPEDSKRTDDENRASPKIWENKKDFDNKAAAFAKVVADNRAKAVASLNGLKAALTTVGKSCDSCHESYRLSKR